jgi:hypothetical protein
MDARPEGLGEFIPVHRYLLIEQGVTSEFHFLEDPRKTRRTNSAMCVA